MSKTRSKKVQAHLIEIQKHLTALNDLLKETPESNNFEEIPGVLGTFDGEFMITPAGEKFEVSKNYAAKSHIMYGDELKMIQENGKPFFKNISKKKIRRIKGVLAKKEGQWNILADCGSYLISDTAAEFNGAQPHLEAEAFIPDDNPNVPFAALCLVHTPKPEVAPEPTKKIEEPKPSKPSKPAEIKKKKPDKPALPVVKPEIKKHAPTADLPVAPESTHTIQLGDDDLR